MDTFQNISNSSDDIYKHSTEDSGDFSMRNLTPKLIALVLGFFAISLNVMSLLALSQIKNRITTHHRFIISLAVSDIVIGVSIVMHFIATSVTHTYKLGVGPPDKRLVSRCLSMFTKALNSTGMNISLLNLMAMALDHYMAIIRPLHYPSQMNKKTAYILIALMWMVAVLLGFSDFFTAVNIYLHNDLNYNYCEATYKSKYQDEYAVFSITFLATLEMIIIYSRIYFKIKKHQRPGEENPVRRKSTVRTDMKRNVRALVTTLLILGTFMICWLPNCIFQIALVIQVKVDKSKVQAMARTLYLIDPYWFDLLLLNSIADPIIYAVRMYDVQMGYRRLLSKCVPNSRLARDTNSTFIAGSRIFADRKCRPNDATSCGSRDRVELQRSCCGNNAGSRGSSCHLDRADLHTSISGNSSSDKQPI